MNFYKTQFKEVFLIIPDVKEDERGYFYRSFAIEEFKRNGADISIVHINRGYNNKKGTIRGFHYQVAPKAEDKVVQALKGSFYDIVVDLRPGSSTYKKWQGFEISADKKNMILVPKGFAHGMQMLEDDCEVQYFMSEFYSPEHARGLRWNDPAFGFIWPLGEPTVISEKDAGWPDFS